MIIRSNYSTMMNSSAKLILVFSLFLTSCVRDAWAETYVEINNSLPTGTPLTVHCKSNDVDLGVHNITDRKWGFSFNPSYFGTTLYSCSFAWSGQLKYFDIFVQTREIAECDDVCIWKIFADGPCMRGRSSGKFDICYSWKRPTNI